MTKIVIVGGGHAGAQAAISLRQNAFSGSVTLLTAEEVLPYQRPPLSKDYLTGKKSVEGLQIRPPEFWSERGISIRPGQRVTQVNPRKHHVRTGAGATFDYDQLIWAAGGRPRLLACTGNECVHVIRTRSDVDRLRSELPRTRRVVIVGGGYLGLEAAAGLTKLGKNVTLVDACERLLSRVAAEPLSRFYEMEHRSHGVDIRLKTEVRSIERVASRLRARLTDGDLVPCDLIIAGVGIEPEVEPLLAAGAEGRNGVRVDDECRTSLHDVFAIGDCALHANVFAEGADVRLESIQNANDMANAVAKTLSGIPTSYEAVPWFWSPTKCPTIAS